MTTPIQEVALKDLDPRLQKQVENAQKSMEKGDVGLVIDVCTNILVRNPGCLDVRKILRMAQYRKAGPRKPTSFGQIGLKLKGLAAPKKAAVEKEPQKFLDQAEAALAKDPYDVIAYRTLAKAATALGLKGTAAQALEDANRLDPEDFQTLIDLGFALIEAGRNADATKIGDMILKRQPGNSEGGEVLKRASVATAMKGGWEQGEGGGDSFKSAVKNSAEAIELEKLNAAYKDEATLKTLIERSLRAIEAQPDDLKAHDDISGYYRDLKDFDNALLWIRKARALPKGATDASLERKEQKLVLDALQKKVDDAQVAGDDAKVVELTKEFNRARRVQVEALVEKYPNDSALHFEYGQILMGDGEFDKAMREFQQSQRSPKHRIQSLLNLAKCFKARNMLDMAVEQLEACKKDIPGMDAVKKEAVYELGECYERMGRKADALIEYKLIFAVDMGYRDVDAKIKASYNTGA